MNESDQPNQGSGEAAANSAATQGAEAIVKRRRGRPKGSGNSSPETGGGGATGDLAARRAELQAQFERLYDPDVWEGLVAAPADIALAITGDEVWDISQKERKTLAVQAAATARCFVIQDPKWLALTMLAISVTTIYGARTMEYFAKRAKEKADKENKREE